MPLSKRRLNLLAKERKQEFEPIREFDNGTNHPVVLMRISHNVDSKWGNIPWTSFMCPCDLKWEWEWEWWWSWREFWKLPRRRMIMTGGIQDCSQKDAAREVIREEIIKQYRPLWSTKSLADGALDIWNKHRAGEYLGEHDPGTLYVQDLERLLGTSPEIMNIHLAECKNSNGEVISPACIERVSFPSKTILSAVAELQKRKLLDLSGMILVPYKEYFRFPEQLHHLFAGWIEEPLGWPNGDAGDCFMHELYQKIFTQTGWNSGEEVFGVFNIPHLTPAWSTHTENWIAQLDPRLGSREFLEKAIVLDGISVEEWVSWLRHIQTEIASVVEG